MALEVAIEERDAIYISDIHSHSQYSTLFSQTAGAHAKSSHLNSTRDDGYCKRSHLNPVDTPTLYQDNLAAKDSTVASISKAKYPGSVQ